MSQVSRSVVYHVGFDGEIAYAYEELLMESIAPFAGHPINPSNSALLTRVINAVIEPVLSTRDEYYAHINEEEDAEYVDQIGDETANAYETALNDTVMRARKKKLHITDSITTASNNSDGHSDNDHDNDVDDDDDRGVDEWMDRVMQKSEHNYLQEESEYGDVAPDVGASDFPHQGREEAQSSEQGSDSDSISLDSNGMGKHVKVCKHASSSDSEDTLHSESSVERRQHQHAEQPFQSPAPYQVRKSAHSYDTKTAETAEPLPAWLMPKSPLDGYFRKGYGGLGHEELADVIEEVTSSQKKALRAGKIADDNEISSSESERGSDVDSSGVDEDLAESERSQTDLGEIDEPLPAWLMPKSPLDAHFRKGYGGLGHEDLSETIAEVTASQKKARQAAARHEMDDEANAITLEDLPENFGMSTLVHTAPAHAVGTPTNVRPSRSLTGSGGSSGGNTAKGIEYAKQQKLFQSPNPSSKIRVTVKNGNNNTVQTEESGAQQFAQEPLPAWLIPKSPLDAHFRKGYGGLGHEDLSDAIEHVTSTQKKKKAAQKALSLSQDSAGNSITKMLENFYDSKPSARPASSKALPAPVVFKEKKKLRKSKKSVSSKHPTAAGGLSSKAAANGASTRVSARQKKRITSADDWGEASEQIMFDSEVTAVDPTVGAARSAAVHDADGLVDEGHEHLLPSAHPSNSLPLNASGGLKLTNNPTLNAMMQDSFKAFVVQYAAANQQKPTAASPKMHGELANGHAKSPTSKPSPKASSKVGTSAGKKAATPHSARKTSTTEDDQLAAYLTSPKLQYSLDEIDNLIRANLSKLTKMQAKEEALRSSFSSGLSLTDQESTPPKKNSATRPKLTKRASRYAAKATAPEPPAKSKTVTKPAVKVGTTTLHTRSTGNIRNSVPAVQSTSRERRSSTPTVTARSQSHPSKISKDLLSSPPRSGVRSSNYGGHSPIAAVASRPLSANSRLCAPTVATLIRSADIATNSSKAANIHNEWHLQLRVAEHGEPDIEITGRKLNNKLLRHSMPSVDADQILGWQSPGNLRSTMLLELSCS